MKKRIRTIWMFILMMAIICNAEISPVMAYNQDIADQLEPDQKVVYQVDDMLLNDLYSVRSIVDYDKAANNGILGVVGFIETFKALLGSDHYTEQYYNTILVQAISLKEIPDSTATWTYSPFMNLIATGSQKRNNIFKEIFEGFDNYSVPAHLVDSGNSLFEEIRLIESADVASMHALELLKNSNDQLVSKRAALIYNVVNSEDTVGRYEKMLDNWLDTSFEFLTEEILNGLTLDFIGLWSSACSILLENQIENSMMEVFAANIQGAISEELFQLIQEKGLIINSEYTNDDLYDIVSLAELYFRTGYVGFKGNYPERAESCLQALNILHCLDIPEENMVSDYYENSIEVDNDNTKTDDIPVYVDTPSVTEKQIQDTVVSVFSNHLVDDYFMHEYYSLNLEQLDILNCYKNDECEEITVAFKLGNDEYKVQRELTLYFEHYEEGWAFTDISDISYATKAINSLPQSISDRVLSEYYFDSYTFNRNEFDYEKQITYSYYDVSYTSTYYTYQGRITLASKYYSIDGHGAWEHSLRHDDNPSWHIENMWAADDSDISCSSFNGHVAMQLSIYDLEPTNHKVMFDAVKCFHNSPTEPDVMYTETGTWTNYQIDYTGYNTYAIGLNLVPTDEVKERLKYNPPILSFNFFIDDICHSVHVYPEYLHISGACSAGGTFSGKMTEDKRLSVSMNEYDYPQYDKVDFEYDSFVGVLPEGYDESFFNDTISGQWQDYGNNFEDLQGYSSLNWNDNWDDESFEEDEWDDNWNTILFEEDDWDDDSFEEDDWDEEWDLVSFEDEDDWNNEGTGLNADDYFNEHWEENLSVEEKIKVIDNTVKMIDEDILNGNSIKHSISSDSASYWNPDTDYITKIEISEEYHGLYSETFYYSHGTLLYVTYSNSMAEHYFYAENNQCLIRMGWLENGEVNWTDSDFGKWEFNVLTNSDDTSSMAVEMRNAFP